MLGQRTLDNGVREAAGRFRIIGHYYGRYIVLNLFPKSLSLFYHQVKKFFVKVY